MTLIALSLSSLALNLHLPDRSPAPTTRRAALGAALGVCVPAAAHAAFEVPLNKLEGGYKVRDYGNGVSSYNQPAADAASAGVCTKSGPGCMPDGFGGFKPRNSDPTAPLYKRVGDAVFSDADGAAPPPPPRAAAPPPPPKAAARSSAPALTFEDLVANSIASKEELLGRKLTDAEKGALVAKLEALMK